MKQGFEWGEEVIDSRDVNERFEELQDEYDSLASALEDAQDEYDQHKTSKSSTDELSLSEEEKFEETLESLQEVVDEAQEALDEFNQSFERDELDTLVEVIAQGENIDDWNHGVTMILESNFTEYVKNLINDTCEMPKEFESGQWPYNHMEIDFESAAEELKADYTTIEVDGNTYYLRG